MVWDILLGSMLSSMAGLTLAVVTAVLADHREKQRWLQRKVHRPLYGELTNVISGEMPHDEDGYVSLWAGLDYYKTYRVDADLAEVLDRYASEISELAGCERDEDFAAFVRAIPDAVCEGEDPVARLPSGRTVDVRTWLKRNALVLATDPAFRGGPDGFELADLDYLWAEVDGISLADVRRGDVDTAEVLEVVSLEFNWGYEAFYRQWDDGWADDLAAALRVAADDSGSAVHEMLSHRRTVGETASDAKALIEARAERGLFRSLWHEWLAT